MEQKTEYRTVARNGGVATHAALEDSKFVLEEFVGGGDTYAEIYTRDNSDDEWELTSREHVWSTDW